MKEVMLLFGFIGLGVWGYYLAGRVDHFCEKGGFRLEKERAGSNRNKDCF